MAYTSELKELIKKVETKRLERVESYKRGEHFPYLSLEEIEKRIKTYHPAYREDATRHLKIGPNKGERVPHELANLLEAMPRIPVDKINLDTPDFETDVLIIGGGGAGSAAAVMARENGARVLLVNKLRHGDSNTVMAEGGFQGAESRVDSPYYHFLDFIGGGHFTNDPELVMKAVLEGPIVINWLEGLGVVWDKNPDGSIKLTHGGGTSRKRMHSVGDMSGLEILRVLRDEIKSYPEEITVLEFLPAVELILDDEGKSAGAILYNLETEEYYVIKAKATIIATGGCGRLHQGGFATTNHYGATADGVIMGYRAGVPLRFMEDTQFHPTGAQYPEQNIGLLITEKVRGMGATFVNVDGEEFVYPLETRDVESASIIRECFKLKKGVSTPTGRVGVWLDSPMIDLINGEGTVKKYLPAKYFQFMKYGIDIAKEPMLVFPTIHYQNGGLRINPEAETIIPGLFVAGEASGGLHGKNRLMGNSLLDITVFGRIAGINAAKYAKTAKIGKLTLEHAKKYIQELENSKIKSESVSPMLLPNYINPEVIKKDLTSHFEGTIR